MWIYILAAFLGLLAAAYFYLTRDFGYFKSQGIPEAPGSFPFGSNEMKRMFTGKENFFSAMQNMYYHFKDETCFGYYIFGSKTLIVKDLDLAKQIMIKDFDYFADRRPLDVNKGDGNYSNKVFSEMLTALTGEKWKSVRGLLSPVFTSGKLKTMGPLINKVIN